MLNGVIYYLAFAKGGTKHENDHGNIVLHTASRRQWTIGGGGGTPYIQMIGMIVVILRGCNRRFSIF